MPVKKFKSKPVTVEAIRLTTENRDEVLKWIGEGNYIERSWDPVNILLTHHHNGAAIPGDYIIKNKDGGFYSMNRTDFESKFAEVVP